MNVNEYNEFLQEFDLKDEEFIDNNIPKNWEIHHIDLDVSNDSIDNLLALPKDIHQKYHKIVYTLSEGLIDPTEKPYISLFIGDIDPFYTDNNLKIATKELYPFLIENIPPYFALKHFLHIATSTNIGSYTLEKSLCYKYRLSKDHYNKLKTIISEYYPEISLA